jgi:hypothetical protein
MLDYLIKAFQDIQFILGYVNNFYLFYYFYYFYFIIKYIVYIYMNSRTKNYLIVLVLIISFSVSLYNIKLINDKEEKTEKDRNYKKVGRFVSPAITMISFFVACYFISVIITEGETIGKDKYTGIFFMLIIGFILTIMNFTILAKNKLDTYIKGKKFSIIGLFMALGVSAIVFGFLDNFGMKLGTEALDDTFLQVFLSPFSIDKRFVNHEENIKKNLSTINTWVSNDWRRLVNQVLRFKNEISNIPNFADLTNAINKFDCDKLNIPNDILKDKKKTNQYVDNLRSKYDIIDGSKAMLGNTFSDFIGAILGAALINLFTYMTSYDGVITGDDNIDSNFFVRNLNYYAPFMEAIFIALGCLVPVFLNIAMSRGGNAKNNMYCWIIVGVMGISILGMMYLSSKGVSNMNYNDKKNSLKKTLNSIRERIDLDNKNGEQETKLNKYIDNLITQIDTIN